MPSEGHDFHLDYMQNQVKHERITFFTSLTNLTDHIAQFMWIIPLDNLFCKTKVLKSMQAEKRQRGAFKHGITETASSPSSPLFLTEAD